MTFEQKIQKSQLSRFVIKSRWWVFAAIALTGVIHKVLGGTEFSTFNIILLLSIGYFFNLIYFLVLRRNPRNISSQMVNFLCVFQIIVDLILYTIVIYMTGGVESLAFLFYFFAIFMGLIILREKQIIGITLIALLMYISIIVLEYAQIIPHIPYFPDGKGYYLDLNITLNNTITVTLAFLSSAFFVSILSQQIRKREEELMRERDRVKDLSEIKEEFISVAAHQIRSPLNSLKWLFRSLLEGDVGKINKKQEHFLEEGRDRTDKLIHVLNDLLDVSKFERGGFAEIKTKVDISNLVYEVLDQYFPNAKEKDIDLQFNYKIRVPEFKVDKEKIKMVIENLVDNAIKYNKDGGVVEIGLKRLNDSIVLSVKDNGIGIPKSEEKKIFSKFFRSKNAKLVEVTGSGLGLYISKEIVDAHQGKIWFKTSENNGTTFFVELPIME